MMRQSPRLNSKTNGRASRMMCSQKSRGGRHHLHRLSSGVRVFSGSAGCLFAALPRLGTAENLEAGLVLEALRMALMGRRHPWSSACVRATALADSISALPLAPRHVEIVFQIKKAARGVFQRHLASRVFGRTLVRNPDRGKASHRGSLAGIQ